MRGFDLSVAVSLGDRVYEIAHWVVQHYANHEMKKKSLCRSILLYAHLCYFGGLCCRRYRAAAKLKRDT